MGALGWRRVEDELAWAHQEAALLSAYDCVFARKAEQSPRRAAAVRSRPGLNVRNPRLGDATTTGR